MVYTFWGRSPRQNKNIFVVSVLLLLGLAFMLLNNKPSNILPFPPDREISQENANQILKEDGEKCDIFTGDWIPYHEEPLYNKSCNFIYHYQNCMKNGRPDTDYLYWRWKPRGCGLPRFDPVRFLELMRNKSWAFIGDSISRNHFESFFCILTTVEKAVMIYDSDDHQSQKWLIPSYNFSASLVWSPFLANAIIPKEVYYGSQSELFLHLDELDTNWTDQYNTWDYMIFSAGRWFSKSAIYYENNTVLGCHFYPKRNNTEEFGLDLAYRKVIRNVLDYIAGSNHNRSTTPDHFESGEWNNGGSCNRKVPAKEGEFELAWLDKAIRNIEQEEFDKALIENGVNLRLLDVNRMALLRPDGHPDVYGLYQPFEKAKVSSDCLHWCLPGPIDTWNDLLMEMIVHG